MKEHIIINKDRTVVVPDSVRKIGIQYDHKVNTLTFDCPRYADDNQSIDLSRMAIYINFSRNDKTKGSIAATNVFVDPDDPEIMHFDFVITRSVTLVNGPIICLVCAKSTDAEGVEDNHWNSELFNKLSVGEGMEAEEELTDEEIDYITQMLQGLNTANAEIVELDRRVSALENDIGSVEDLNTEDKSTVVAAVNEVKSETGELKGDLDNYINVPHIIDVDIEKETGKAYKTTDGTYVDNLSGFECASIPVNPNDTLIISGWGGDSNSYKPRFWSDTAVIETISTAEDVFTDVTVTVPSGANRLLINGRTALQSIIVKKLSQNDVSKDFYASYGKRVGVNYSAEKTVDVFIKDYSKGKDLVVRMWGKASNNLPDFGNIGTVENDGIYVLDSIGDKTIESITSGTTDFLSPSVVYAVNNADGDYLGNTDDKLTGGWHGFNNATSGATATARNTKFIVSCDGNTLNIGEKARGNEVTIEITNRLQGSNTEKQDGSGREIVEQYFRITIGDGLKIEVDGEIRALEDIAYQTYYGLSLYHTMPNDVYFVGCRANRGAKAVTSVNRCGDTNCVGIRQVGEKNTLEMLFDSSYDLGKQYANSWGNSCIMSSNKSYLVLIKGKSDGTERLQLNSGDRVYWRGYYNFYPTN